MLSVTKIIGIALGGLVWSTVLLGVARAQTETCEQYYDSAPGKCQPGEYAVTTRVDVGYGQYRFNGNPTGKDCLEPSQQRLSQIFRELADSYSSGSEEYAGPILDETALKAKGIINKNAGGGTIGKLLSDYVGDGTPNCTPVCVSLPKGSRYTGYRLTAWAPDTNKTDACADDNSTIISDCGGVPYAAFAEAPQPDPSKNGNITVCSMFMNWSHNQYRKAIMSIFFIPPSGWTPR